MQRITYKKIKEWIEDWNENTPLHYPKFEISAYSGFYHLQNRDTQKNIITMETPGKLWEAFCIWKDGFYKGKEITTKRNVDNKNHNSETMSQFLGRKLLPRI